MKMRTRTWSVVTSVAALLAGCLAAQTSPASPALDLGAAVRPAPTGARFIDERFYIWCGTMTRTADGRCHLYYSRWPRALGHNAWVTHSEIAYAVADEPLGPFRHVNVALAPRGAAFWDGMVTHNPNILRVDGKFYLYYMGNRGDGKSYWVHRNNQRIGLAVADDPRGPWRRLDSPIVDVSPDKSAFDSLMTSNPAACLRPDGGVLLLYKAVIDNGSERGGAVRFGAAIAKTPAGPYVKQPGQIFEPDAKHASAWMVGEDPFVWYSERYGRKYYALSRDVVGMFTGAAGGITLLESADGLTWRAAPHPAVLGKDFAWADGTRSGTKLERPQLYLDEAGVPRVLYGAVDINTPQNRSHSFNVALPLAPQ